MQRTFYLLAETEPNSGTFELTGASTDAGSTTEALAALAPSAGSARFGVWPYRRMSGEPPIEAPAEVEHGARYHTLEQPGGASQPFVLTETELTSGDADASSEAISRSLDAGYRIGLFPVAAETGNSASTAPVTDAAAEHDTDAHAA